MRKVLVFLIIGMGLTYIFLIPEQPIMLKIGMKVVPMLLIILFGILTKTSISSTYKRTIIAGLIVCMIADAVIYWFLAGLVTFFVGHLIYIGAFRSVSRKKVPLFVAIPLLIYGLFMIGWIAVPQLVTGELVLGVAIIGYIVVILFMGWEAIRTRFPLAISGALLFICSDSLLAIDRFVIELPQRDALVMITYYAAQVCIAASIGGKEEEKDWLKQIERRKTTLRTN